MPENDLSKIKEKYENVDLSPFNELVDKISELTNTLERNFKKLNTNLLATALLFSKFTGIRKLQQEMSVTADSFKSVGKKVESIDVSKGVQKVTSSFKNLEKNVRNVDISSNIQKTISSFENLERSSEKVSKSKENLARVITTGTGTYVRMYRTVESYYITQKALLRQLKSFHDGLDAVIVQLRNFDAAAYFVDAFRIRLVKTEAAIHFFSSIVNTAANVFSDISGVGRKMSVIDKSVKSFKDFGFVVTGNIEKIRELNSGITVQKSLFGKLGTLIKDFWKGTDGAKKEIEIFGKKIHYQFEGVSKAIKKVNNASKRIVDSLRVLSRRVTRLPVTLARSFYNGVRRIGGSVVNYVRSIEFSKEGLKKLGGDILALGSRFAKSSKALFLFTKSLIASAIRISVATVAAMPLVLLFVALGIALKKVVDVIMKFNIGGVQTFIIETVAMIKNFFFDVTISILKIFKELNFGETIRSLLGDVFELIRNTLKALFPAMKVAVMLIVITFKLLAITLKPIIKFLSWLMGIVADITDILATLFMPLLKGIYYVVDKISMAFGWLYDEIKKLLRLLGLLPGEKKEEKPPTTLKELGKKIFEDLSKPGISLLPFNMPYTILKDVASFVKARQTTNIQQIQQTKNIQPTYNITVYTNDKAVVNAIRDMVNKSSLRLNGQ